MLPAKLANGKREKGKEKERGRRGAELITGTRKMPDTMRRIGEPRLKSIRLTVAARTVVIAFR